MHDYSHGQGSMGRMQAIRGRKKIKEMAEKVGQLRPLKWRERSQDPRTANNSRTNNWVITTKNKNITIF